MCDVLQEVALVQHSERTATVESVTSMQLLVVSREDFMDIFFSSGGEGSEPDHISFCRLVMDMSGDILVDNEILISSLRLNDVHISFPRNYRFD